MTDESSNNDEELRLKIYGEARSDLLKRQLSNSENADRAILSVSTAALGFSLAFLKDIVPLQDAVLGFLPYISWALFVLSIVVTLLSFFTSQKAIDDQLVLAHRYYIERDESAVQVRTRSALLTERLNIAGAMLLVAGLFATCAFVGINFGKGIDMTDKKQMNEGSSAPTMQKVPQSGSLEQRGAGIPTLQTVPVKPQSGAPVPGLQKVPTPPVQPPATSENSKNK